MKKLLFIICSIMLVVPFGMFARGGSGGGGFHGGGGHGGGHYGHGGYGHGYGHGYGYGRGGWGGGYWGADGLWVPLAVGATVGAAEIAAGPGYDYYD